MPEGFILVVSFTGRTSVPVSTSFASRMKLMLKGSFGSGEYVIFTSRSRGSQRSMKRAISFSMRGMSSRL